MIFLSLLYKKNNFSTNEKRVEAETLQNQNRDTVFSSRSLQGMWYLTLKCPVFAATFHCFKNLLDLVGLLTTCITSNNQSSFSPISSPCGGL